MHEVLVKGNFTYTPKPNRNRTEKIKCLKSNESFHICAETEPKPNAEPKTCTILILFFFGFGGRISANTTGNFNKICIYTNHVRCINLVILKAIDGLSSETSVRLFYKHNTVDYRHLWDNTQTDYKDHELNAMTWNNLYFKWISAILGEISPNYAGIFLDFVHGFGSYVKGLPKAKRCNSVAVAVSVRFRFGFGVYVKQP